MLNLAATPAANEWINARTRWATDETALDGGSPLVPSADGGDDVAYLPGGCWVRVERKEGGGAMIEVGSLSVEAAEVRTHLARTSPPRFRPSLTCVRSRDGVAGKDDHA